jgi:hypothetical protein
LLAVYTGTSVSSLVAVASSPAVSDWPAQVSFVAVAGTTYQIAVDGVGASGGLITLTLTPTRPPSVSITSPTNGSTFSAFANITITANATDSDGSIKRVDFYLGTNSPILVGSATNSPYSVGCNITSGGNYDLVAKATDNMGVSTYSAPVNVDVSFPETGLTSSVPMVNLHGQQGSQAYYKITVPQDCTELDISISNGTGDCDLYVAYGYQPSLYSYDYCPYLHGNNEYVMIYDPTPGDYHIMLNGWDAYAGVTLQAVTY